MTAQWVNLNERCFLVDCGEGTQFQLINYRLKLNRVERIFISHLHGDHYLGLFGLLSTMGLYQRRARLHLYGPPALAELLVAHGRHSGAPLEYPVEFYPTDPDRPRRLYEDELLAIDSVPLRHRLDCTGFVFREKPRKPSIVSHLIPPGFPHEYIRRLKEGEAVEHWGRSFLPEDYTRPAPAPRTYAFCSDTAYDERLVPQVAEADLLYHEATFANRHAERARATLHSTAEQAARIAGQAGVEKLIIGHFSTRYRELDVLLEEARAVFPNTHLALEGRTFPVDGQADQSE